MRTTLDIDDDVIAAARAIARRDKVSVGTVVSILAREALRQPVATRHEGRIPVFDVREDAPAITNEMVRAALDEQ
jgi:hypothetical protein